MLSAVMIDQREPKWLQDLSFGNTPTSVTLLETGDVLATTDDGCLLAIERKTADDLLGSLKDGRLYEQLARLHQLTPYAYLIVCGAIWRGTDGHAVTERGLTGWNYQAVQAALLTCQELGVFVIHSSDDKFETTVIGLGQRDRGDTIQQRPAKRFALLDPGEAVLAALPGIGLERVAALLAYANTPAYALAYLTDLDLKKREHVPGIGGTTKANVRRALGVPDGWELAMIFSQDKENGNGK